MRIWLVGASGGLGKGVAEMLRQAGHTVGTPNSTNVDVTDAAACHDYADSFQPQALINFAVKNINNLVANSTGADATAQLDVSVHGTLNLLRAVLPIMRQYCFGRIILGSSVLSKRPVAGAGIYAAAKAFTDNLAQTVAIENAKYGITCNSLVLGYCAGGLALKLPSEQLARIIDGIPLRRLCTIEEVVKAVSFLLDMEYITGTNMVLAGGL